MDMVIVTEALWREGFLRLGLYCDTLYLIYLMAGAGGWDNHVLTSLCIFLICLT